MFMKPGQPFLFDDATGVVVGIKNSDGTEMLLSGGSYTFAQMKALVGVQDGQTVRVTNYGRGGSTWRYSSALQDWFPVAPVLIYENTTLISGLVQTAAQVLLAIPVEANLLKNKRFRLLLTPAKNGTTDTHNLTLRMGNTGTAADASVVNYSGPNATNRAFGFETWFRMETATSVVRLGGPPGGSFAGSTNNALVANAPTAVADVGSANFVTLITTMGGTTDTPQLGYTALEILP